MYKLFTTRYFIALIAFGSLVLCNSCKNIAQEKSKEKKEIVTDTKEKTIKKTIPKTNQPIVNITPNQKITSPLKILVNSKGFWLASEGELGTVTLVDDNNKIIVSGILSSTDGNWMTSGDAQFSSTLTFDSKGKKRGKLLFKNRLVRKNDVEKTIEIPVQF